MQKQYTGPIKVKGLTVKFQRWDLKNIVFIHLEDFFINRIKEFAFGDNKDCFLYLNTTLTELLLVESSWNLMAPVDEREGTWRANWRTEWVASTLTLPRNMVYPALLPLMRTPRLPVVDWTDPPAPI